MKQLCRWSLVFASFWTAYVALYAVWVPHEVLGLRGSAHGATQDVGYVLDSSDGWVTLLRSGQRVIVKYPADDVYSRQVCKRTSLLLTKPTLWSLMGLFRATATPTCDSLVHH